MSDWMRISKGNLEFDVLHHNREVNVTTTALGLCTQSTGSFLARSYEIMAQFVVSTLPMQGGEKQALEAFFSRNGFTIQHTFSL